MNGQNIYNAVQLQMGSSGDGGVNRRGVCVRVIGVSVRHRRLSGRNPDVWAQPLRVRAEAESLAGWESSTVRCE